MRIAYRILLNLDNILRLNFKFISQYRKKHFIRINNIGNTRINTLKIIKRVKHIKFNHFIVNIYSIVLQGQKCTYYKHIKLEQLFNFRILALDEYNSNKYET